MIHYWLHSIAYILILVTSIGPVAAHEFDDLGILVRHKGNNISIIAAIPLSEYTTDTKSETLNFDKNGDGQVSFKEALRFEDEILKRIEQLIVFQNEDNQKAKLYSFRFLENGYENLLKISSPDDKNNNQTKTKREHDDQSAYIQVSLKFKWDNTPQSIHLSYDLLNTDKKNVLVRNQDIGKSRILVLTSSEPSITIYSNNSANVSNTKPIWILGIEHVIGGLDHLLFILAMVLICKTPIGLIVPLSAFTLTHSFSLALVAFGVDIGAPNWLVEACIAMTIVIMALFELLGWKPKRLFLVTAAMGFIHGFGLGQALTGTMEGVEGWAMALAQVTIGIELAQLAVALIFLSILLSLPRLAIVSRKKLEFSLSFVVLSVGFYWTAERLIS